MRAAASSSRSASGLRRAFRFPPPKTARTGCAGRAATNSRGCGAAGRGGAFVVVTPADIIEQLKAVEKRCPGVDRVVCATPLGTPLEVQLEDLDRFAKEVMPAFRPAK